MSPEQAVLERIQALGPVVAVVGPRVYVLKLPQHGALPAICVQQISEITGYHQRGETPGGPARVQVDVYAAESSGGDPYASAAALAALVHGDGKGANASGLSGWIGTVGGSPPAMTVLGVFRVDRSVGYDAEELREVRVRQDYMVTWATS